MSRTTMSEQNARYHREQLILEGRARKVERLFTTLTLSCHGALPDPVIIRDLDDAGWAALETLAGVKPASAETRAMLIKRIEVRRKADAIVDPFDCF